MNLDLILLIVFYLILYSLFRIYRSKFEVQGKVFVLFKTKIGLNLMDKIANKLNRFLGVTAYVSIFLGFFGMIITLGFLTKGALSFLSIAPQPQIAPVLPGISISGLPKLSFWHWIIAILIAATVHEFMHGIYSRLNKIKIKSSGFGFLGPILAAFVEPDEKDLAKKSTKAQLSVLSAGPFANFIFGVLILLVMIFIMGPIGNAIISIDGVTIQGLNESFPIAHSGIKPGDTINEIEKQKIDSPEKIKAILEKYKPGDEVEIKSEEKYYNIVLGENPAVKGQAFLGITTGSFKFKLAQANTENYNWVLKVFFWLYLLFFWLFNINLGIGLFNLLPLGPVDGGRMFYVGALHFTKNKVKAMRILKFVSVLVLILILVNLWPFIVRMLHFLFAPILALF